MNKKVLFSLLAATALGVGLVGVHTASAQDTIAANPMTSLVQKIADRFGLNTSDVQAVFDEHRNDMHANMQAHYEERLSSLVSEGKITEAQKQLIAAKHTALEANRESLIASFKTMTAEERKAAMQAEKQALVEWASQTGIDVKYMMPFSHGKGLGMRGGMHFNLPVDAPEASN